MWVVTLRDEHDLSTASQLRNSLARSFSGGWTVIVDLSQADFIDGTTLHVLIRARRQRYPIALVAPSTSVAGQLVEQVRLADAIPTYQTRAEALDQLAPNQLAGGKLRQPAGARLPAKLDLHRR